MKRVTPAEPKDRAFGAEVHRRTAEYIEKYGLKGNPITLRGGLGDVPAGFEDMKVSTTRGIAAEQM